MGACSGEHCSNSGQELRPSVEGQKDGGAPTPIKGFSQGSMVTFGFLDITLTSVGGTGYGEAMQKSGKEEMTA